MFIGTTPLSMFRVRQSFGFAAFLLCRSQKKQYRHSDFSNYK